ncbi:MAG: SBBP repeat-containing protein [Candidatus Thorarchaeota archaeon]
MDQISINNLSLSNSAFDDFKLDWNITIGGAYNDFAQGIAMDSQDNIYVAGWEDITGSSTNRDIIIARYNNSGDQQWKRYWGGSEDDLAYDIIIDANDNIFVVGVTKNYGDIKGDAVIIKYNVDGAQEWNMTWGGANYDNAIGIAMDSMNNFYLAGETESNGDTDGDVFIVKFNNNWIEQWNLTWGGSEYDGVGDIHIDSNDNLYITGSSGSIDSEEGKRDVYLAKYNTTGHLQWQQNWSGPASQYSEGVATTTNGNVYIIGKTFGHPTSSGMAFLVIYDSEGNYITEYIWGIIGEYGNCLYKIIFDPSDDPYIVGKTNFYREYGSNDVDAILIHGDELYNPDWRILWKEENNDEFLNLCFDSKSNIYCIGRTNSYGNGANDILLVKYEYIKLKLINPINTTYVDYMKGYYPGTYSFDNDKIGNPPSEWDFIEGGSTSVKVIEEVANHKSIIEFQDNDPNNTVSISKSFENQTSGFLEFWAMGDTDKGSFSLNFFDNKYIVFQLRWVSIFQYLQFWDGNYHNINPVNPYTWYHIRIEFNCDYNSVFISINSEYNRTCNFFSSPSQINRISFQTNTMEANYQYYLDALSYSWDNYRIGENLKEGLLLQFINRTNLDWIGYSLDKQPIEKINGFITLPMPDNGRHNIKLYANDTSGFSYESELIYFTIRITQENKTPNPPTTRHDFYLQLLFLIIIIIIIVEITITTCYFVVMRSFREPSF